jgi:hypothetical protein
MNILNIDKKLNEYIKDLNKFKKTLNKNNAIIAGGFILGNVTQYFKTNDLDIYINAKNLDNFLNEMDELIIIDDDILSEFQKFNNKIIYPSYTNSYEKLYKCKNNNIFNLNEEYLDRALLLKNNKRNHFCNFIAGSEYDLSFFKKNGIKFKLSGHLSNISKIKFDLMVINDDKSIYDVINNFDLTCCQIWYDGYKFNGTHIEDIKNKKTNLNKDYINELINGNKFILNRIKKYQIRGFTINISILNSIDIKKNIKRNIINYEKWLVKSVLSYYYSLFYSLIVNYKKNIKIKSINGLDITSNNSVKQHYIEYLNNFFNVFNYDIYFNETGLYKFVCKNKCILDYNLKKIENENQNQCFIIYKTWIEFYNKFTNFTIDELKLNLYLYFKLEPFNLIKNGIYKYYKDLNKTPNIKKIIDNIEKIIFKEDIIPISIINIKKKENIHNKSLSLSKSETEIKKLTELQKLLKLERLNNINFRLKSSYYYTLKTITKEIDINKLEGTNPIMFIECTIKEYLDKNKNNICIIGLDNKNNIIPNDISFYDIYELFIFYSNLRNGWFYECKTNSMKKILKDKVFVKIPLINIKIFVDHNDIFNLFEYNIKKNVQIFFYKEIGKINYTVSHDNAFNIDPDHVSTALCQEGSNITIHELYSSKIKTKKTKGLSI